MKIMKYIILILAVVQPASLSAQGLYPDVDLATESFSNRSGWGSYTIGHDPTSNWGATPIGTVTKVRIRTAGYTPTVNSTTVRLYSDNTGTTIVSSSTTGNAISLGSNVYEYTLDTPFVVTSGTQMLAYVSIDHLYVDTRTGFTEKYGSRANDPTSNQPNRFTAIQYVFYVPPAPDLVVIDPSVSDATLRPGQSFTIYATVENQGSRSSSSTTLRYYRSTDSTISTGDTQLGTDPVSALSPNGASPENITAPARGPPGTYWVGACVNSVRGESPTNNQCSAGVQIAVATPTPGRRRVIITD